MPWLPPALRRALAEIAAAEGITVRELIVDAVRELVAAYAAREDAFIVKSRAETEQLETIWAPHRDAPSLLGSRSSRCSSLGGSIASSRVYKRRGAA